MNWRKKKKETPPAPPPEKKPIWKYSEGRSLEIEEGTGPCKHTVRMTDEKGGAALVAISERSPLLYYPSSTIWLTSDELEYLYEQMRLFQTRVAQHKAWRGEFGE